MAFSTRTQYLLIAFVLTASLWPQVALAQEIDVFAIAGQSNAVGEGNESSGPAVAAGTAYQFFKGTISSADDPVGGASTGSAWPQFAISYNAATKRRIGLVPTAVGGTALIPENGWQIWKLERNWHASKKVRRSG